MQYVILTDGGKNGYWSLKLNILEWIVSPTPPQTRGSNGLPATGTKVTDNRRQQALHRKLMSWFICILICLWSQRSLNGCWGFFHRNFWASGFHGWNTAISDNWQPGVSKYYWLNWQWAESHSKKNKNRHSDMEWTFQSRITSCSIVFRRNTFVNLACFLNICRHIMEMLCFSTVKGVIWCDFKFCFLLGVLQADCA